MDLQEDPQEDPQADPQEDPQEDPRRAPEGPQKDPRWTPDTGAENYCGRVRELLHRVRELSLLLQDRVREMLHIWASCKGGAKGGYLSGRSTV